jgi:hypothetical protein
MVTLGALAMWGGLGLLLLGALFFIIAAFREGILWGLAVIFLPFMQLVFLIVAWPRAKGAFFIQLYGVGLLLLGIFVLEARLPFVHWHH